jgi:hypothetical protein
MRAGQAEYERIHGTGRRAPRHRRPPDPRRQYRRRGVLAATAASSVVGAVVVAGVMYGGGAGGQRPANAAPPVAVGPTSSVPTGFPSATPRPKRPQPPQQKGPVDSAKPRPKPRPPAAPRPVELLQNGTFTGGIQPWEDDDVDAFADEGLLRVDVFEGDDDGFVDSNRFTLRPDRKYVVTFQAAADNEVEMGVDVVRPDDDPALSSEVDLDIDVRTFSFTFTPDERTPDSFFGFEFDTGADDHQVAIDNVSLMELPR